MPLDYRQEREMLDAVAALGWRYDKPSGGFTKPSGDWLSWAQVEAMWLAAQDGREVTAAEVTPESRAIAAHVNQRANDEAANDDA